MRRTDTARRAEAFCPPLSPSGRGSLPALALVVGFAVAAATPAPARAQAAADFDGSEIVEVVFRGPTVFESALLQSAIVTQATECRLLLPLVPVCWAGFALDRRYLDGNVLTADRFRLLFFYLQRGYRYASVESRVAPLVPAAARGPREAEPPPVRVIFEIEAGEPVRVASLELTGLDAVDDPAIARQLPLRAGGRFDQLVYEETRDTLLSRLRNRGFAHAEVLGSYLIPADSAYVARVEMNVLAGARSRFGAIEVVGTEKVSPVVVRRMLTFQPGDVYRSDELLQSQRNLFGLEVFRHAAILDQVGEPGDTVVPVRVQVSEGDLHRVRVGTGLSTADCVNAEGRWISRNFAGGARRVEVRGRVSNVLAEQFGGFPCFDTGRGEYRKLNGTLGLDFTQPWLFSPANTFGAGLFAERRSLPDVFVRTATGGYVSLTRSMRRGSLTGGYRPELTRLDAEGLIFCVSFVVCELQDIQVLQSPQWLSPLTLSFARDRSDALFSPTRGDVVRIETEYASEFTGSNFAYTRLSGEAILYRGIGRGLILATRLRSGVARSIREPEDGEGLGLHPQKRFFAGGPNSVRGFAQYRLGPKVLTADAATVLAAPVDSGGAGCSVQEINTGTCNASVLTADAFEDVRPVGGAAVFEGSIEARFPLFVDGVQGAAFLDFGQVWTDASDLGLRDLAWTPGFGVRYFSPIGPIRVDLGYNSLGAERLPVITTEVTEERVNTPRLRSLNEPVLWNPRQSFLDRLQLHISIGQAF